MGAPGAPGAGRGEEDGDGGTRYQGVATAVPAHPLSWHPQTMLRGRVVISFCSFFCSFVLHSFGFASFVVSLVRL